jgi:cytochrome-b5 reductase
MRFSWSVPPLLFADTSKYYICWKISGGTGITPFYQLFHSVISRNNLSPTSSGTKYTLLHSSRSPAELPPHAILQPLVSFAAKNADRFQLHLFVDALNGSEDSTQSNYRLQVGRIGKAAIEGSLGLDCQTGFWRRMLCLSPAKLSPAAVHRDRRILFLVCGPNQ